ncbi:MAG: hypothetical protein LBJ93_00690 [Clostridiales bacterium]|jgi:hypothetical protein|nr:hypothetical protein [Clostridiales bacterium]
MFIPAEKVPGYQARKTLDSWKVYKLLSTEVCYPVIESYTKNPELAFKEEVVSAVGDLLEKIESYDRILEIHLKYSGSNESSLAAMIAAKIINSNIWDVAADFRQVLELTRLDLENLDIPVSTEIVRLYATLSETMRGLASSKMELADSFESISLTVAKKAIIKQIANCLSSGNAKSREDRPTSPTGDDR